jgi:uncharacterized membrane protein YhiD involved in acid resistance
VSAPLRSAVKTFLVVIGSVAAASAVIIGLLAFFERWLGEDWAGLAMFVVIVVGAAAAFAHQSYRFARDREERRRGDAGRVKPAPMPTRGRERR